MDRSTPIYLVEEIYKEDQYGVLQPTSSERKVYANVTSVGANEWFEGGRNGLNPEYRIRMFGPDYKGEEIVKIGSVYYTIYRTFQDRTDVLELYVEKRKGKTKYHPPVVQEV